MTQIVVTLENDADSTFLRRMIENMKGVLNTSLQFRMPASKSSSTENWISRMQELSGKIDSTVLDLDDERTRYIMGE